MPDPTPPTPPKPRAPRGTVNKEYADGLQKAQDILNAALNPLYNAEIVDGVEITAAFLTDLGTQITDARTFLTSATSGRGASKASTVAEAAAKTALAQALQGIQTRAYQKFHESNPDRVRDTYFGGVNLFKASDSLLPQIVVSYLQNAPGDDLAKVDAARIAELQSLSDAWDIARGAQGGASISSFEDFKVAYDKVEANRRTIQFAGDDDFPYFDPTNKAAREAFKIDADGPFRP